MKLELTRRGDYAMRAMLALAQAGGGALTAPRIAELTKVPPNFLPQVDGRAVRVRASSTRGSGGSAATASPGRRPISRSSR